jgi:hypothetical protein
LLQAGQVGGVYENEWWWSQEKSFARLAAFDFSPCWCRVCGHENVSGYP